MSTHTKQPISAYYHTHWDREWYLPFRTYQIRLAEVVDAVLARLEEGSLPCFMLDGQTVVLSDYLELRPNNRERLQCLIRDGRLRIGPWFVMPDEFLVCGESLIRNLLLGIREARAWGCNTFTGYLPDTFGHSADIPTILTHFGLDSAIVWRGVNPKESLFRWRSPNGDSVLALHLTDGYFQMALQDWTLSPTEQIAALDTLKERLEKAASPGNPVLLPVGGDHLTVLPEEGRARLREHFPELNETTPERYLSNIQPPEPLEVLTGELTDQSGSFLLSGVYSARLYLKQANRRMEHALTRRLEPLLAMTQLLLPPDACRYPAEELALAWRTLLLNHPHDSICGCSVDAVHRENEQRFEQVAQIAEALEHRAVHALWQHAGMADCWMVFNTGNRPYTGVVPVSEDLSENQPGEERPSGLPFPGTEDEVLQDEYLYDTGRIPLSHLMRKRRHGWIYVENLPPLGFRLIPKSNTRGQAPETVRVSENGLENGHLNIRIGQDGALNITDKRTGAQYPDLMHFRTQADQGDSYNGAPVPGSTIQKLRQVGPMVCAGDGTLVGSLTLTYALSEEEECGPFALELTLTLTAGSPALRMDVGFINRHWTAQRLEAVFSSDRDIREMTAEGHLGIIVRQYDPAYRIEAHMPVERNRELSSHTGPIQRFINFNGQSLLSEGLTEYAVRGDTLGVTLLRAFQSLSSADTGVRGAQAGPPLATPEGACIDRPAHYRLAWLPTPEEPHVLYDAAARFYGDVWGIAPDASGAASLENSIPNPSEGSLLTWDEPTIVGMACYFIPGKGLAVRLLNTVDHPVTIRFRTGFPWVEADEIDFLENARGAVNGDSLAFEAKAVKTLLFRTAFAL